MTDRGQRQPIPFGRGLALQGDIASRALTASHRRGLSLQDAIRLVIEDMVRQGTFGAKLDDIVRNPRRTGAGK